jgi:hypothetical protein
LGFSNEWRSPREKRGGAGCRSWSGAVSLGEKGAPATFDFVLERFPTRRNRLVDKKSLQIQKPEAKSCRKSLSTFSDFALG